MDITMSWEYDKEADVLYISFDKSRPSVSVDMGNSVILREDNMTGETTGITIVGLKAKLPL